MTLKKADANTLIRETASTRSILLGGQAVAFWADYFHIQPKLPALTRDIDYLATAAEAKRAAAKLSFPVQLKIATFDDATPNSAVLTVTLDGYDEPVIVDYLINIIGPTRNQIEKTSVEVEYGGNRIRIIHPLLLLQSKIANIHKLESKRTPEAIEQARLAIAIVAAFIDQRFREKAARRELLKMVQSITKYAATQSAQYVRKHYGLKCIDAIPASVMAPGVLPDAFHERQLPRLMGTIERAHDGEKSAKHKISRTAKVKR